MLRYLFLWITLLSSVHGVEYLALDVIAYEDFIQNEPNARASLKKALYEKGIVGIKGVPGYKEKVSRFIQAARTFSSLPEEIKEAYAPNRSLGELFLGYEKGKERFQRPDGKWVIDDLKASYYAFVPDCLQNRWPRELNLKGPYLELSLLMSSVGEEVMRKIGLTGFPNGISLEGAPRVGRMLHYCKNERTEEENPFWCGAHCDHGVFTVLIPSFYFEKGKAIPEPEEAGLFVKTAGKFKKVKADDPEVMLFQVGEFGQLATNDAIRATEHRVHKAKGQIERYTMALFYDAPMHTTIYSFSELTRDERYGGKAGTACTYKSWSEASYRRYAAKEN